MNLSKNSFREFVQSVVHVAFETTATLLSVALAAVERAEQKTSSATTREQKTQPVQKMQPVQKPQPVQKMQPVQTDPKPRRVEPMPKREIPIRPGAAAPVAKIAEKVEPPPVEVELPPEVKVTFAELGLCDDIRDALEEKGYTAPSPIQVQSIPPALSGRDILGCAQTGTGKTAAFSLPILQRIAQNDETLAGRAGGVRALIVTPTRELAVQIGESIASYGKNLRLKHAVIYGGVSQAAQTKELRCQPDILVATPGRLLDLIGQGFIRLRSVGIFVLDEADRMLDMGFLPDVKKIIAELPATRQNLLFSATMPADIQGLADSILRDPVKVQVARASSSAQGVEQKVCFVAQSNKKKLLEYLLRDPSMTRAIVFTRTKHVANRLSDALNNDGILSGAIHSNKSQAARQRALEEFKNGELRVLVASDIASRGIDVDSISHVVNFDLPNLPETYVHRIGRTGRADAKGIAISFCEFKERPFLRDIESLIKQNLLVMKDHPFDESSREFSSRQSQ